MASESQIAANRLNAGKSTGPRTHTGRMRSRRNALRHGLTAETVLDQLEDPDEYRAFERAITADFAPATTIERALVVRLASLLWRLKRATTMETGLLANPPESTDGLPIFNPASFVHLAESTLLANHDPAATVLRLSISLVSASVSGHMSRAGLDAHPEITETASTTMRAFSRIISTNHDSFTLVLRYQTSLSRQLAQTLISIAQVRQQTRFAHLIRQKRRKTRRAGPAKAVMTI